MNRKVGGVWIVAMRGRNPENPNSRIKGDTFQQRLEPNQQGISNTVTTVTKDNLVLEEWEDLTILND